MYEMRPFLNGRGIVTALQFKICQSFQVLLEDLFYTTDFTHGHGPCGYFRTKFSTHVGKDGICRSGSATTEIGYSRHQGPSTAQCVSVIL